MNLITKCQTKVKSRNDQEIADVLAGNIGTHTRTYPNLTIPVIFLINKKGKSPPGTPYSPGSRSAPDPDWNSGAV